MNSFRLSLPRLLLCVVAAFVLFRLWTSYCFFFLPEWNETRLAPAFMIGEGHTPYPGLNEGPLTTWIYGPVALLLCFPATWAQDVVTAIGIAGVINVLFAVLPLALLAWCLRDRGDMNSGQNVWWTVFFALSLWPNSCFHYFQSDNAALAFALLANLLLSRSQRPGTLYFFAAALCAALSVWSKQIYVSLIPAQLLWIWLTQGRKASFQYALLCVGLGAALAEIFFLSFGFNGILLNLVRIPSGVPYCDQDFSRIVVFWKEEILALGFPTAGLLYFRRSIRRKDSPWLLPSLCWLCFLPLGLSSFLKLGGSTNALFGYLFLIIPASAALVGFLTRRFRDCSALWLAALAVLALFFQFANSPRLPLQPLTTHLLEAEDLAKAYPQQIYFPWNPLVTWFSDHRFYHAEDGLHTRTLAGLPASRAHSHKELPARWSMSAVPGWRTEGSYRGLQPTNAQMAYFGKWTLFVWPAQQAVSPAPPASTPAPK